MVKYKLIEENDEYLIYDYYPEIDFDKVGRIVIDVQSKKGYIEALSKDDLVYVVPKEELPNVKENQRIATYADKAIRDILRKLNDGIIAESGTVIWY